MVPVVVKRCRLCLEERQLIKAHIIPRAFWPLDECTPKVLSNNSGIYPSRSPQGVYDPDILCGKCDAELLGPLDQHAAKALLRGKRKVLSFRGMAIRQYPEAEAAKIRVFVASVAWRASISKHRFFARVKLARYEDVIRQMIMGVQTEQGSIEIAIAEFDGAQGILDPHQTRFDGVRFNLIYADRFVFYIKTDRRPCPEFLVEGLVRPERPVITIPRSWYQSKERDLMQRIARSHPKAFPERS